MDNSWRIKMFLLGLLIWCAGSVALWYTLPYEPKATLTTPEGLTFEAFSPGGKFLATKSRQIVPTVKGMSPRQPNGPIRLWDTDTGQQVACFPEEEKFVRRVMFSNNDKTIILESDYERAYDRIISILDVQTSKQIDVIRQTSFTSMGVFPHTSFQLLVTLLSFDPYPTWQCCYLNPDGKTLFFDHVWRSGNWVIVWDIQERRIRQALDRFQWPISPDQSYKGYSAFSPSGQFYQATMPTPDAEGNWQGETILSEVGTGEVIVQIPFPAYGFIFSPDGKLLAAEVRNESAHGQREVRVWDVASRKEVATLPGGFSPVFSRNSKRLAIRELDLRNIKVLDTATWREVHELLKSPDKKAKGSVSQVIAGPNEEDFRAVVFDNGISTSDAIRKRLDSIFGSASPASSYGSTKLKIVDVATRKNLLEMTMTESSWFGGQATAASTVYLSPDGRTLALEPMGKAGPTSHSILLFNIPPNRPMVAIIAWPFFGSLVVAFVASLIHRRKRKQKNIAMSAALPQLN